MCIIMEDKTFCFAFFNNCFLLLFFVLLLFLGFGGGVGGCI